MCGTMSHAKALLHWSVIHYQVTFEWQSGRGSETSLPVYIHTGASSSSFSSVVLMCSNPSLNAN